jgi:hypothetical protein
MPAQPDESSREPDRLRFAATVVAAVAGLVVLQGSVPHPGPLAQDPLLSDTILVTVLVVFTCICWPLAIPRAQHRTLMGGIGSLLIMAVGAILIIQAAHRLLPIIFAGRINAYQGDMLVVIEAGIDRFLHHQDPYTLYHVPWEVPLPYGPWLWMPYIVPHVLRIDPRVLTLVAYLTVVSAIAWSGVPAMRAGDTVSGLMLIALATALALNSRIEQFYVIGHTFVYWPLLFALAFELRADRGTAVAFLAGSLVPARTTMVSVIPIVVLHLYYRRQLTTRRTLLMAGAAILPFLPFAIADWRSFTYDVFVSYVVVVKGFVWHSTDWAHRTLGLTGLLLRHGLGAYVAIAQIAMMLLVYGLALRAIRRGARPEPWLALSLLAFSMTALWPLIYLYFDVFVLLASALASHGLVNVTRQMRLLPVLAGCITGALAVVIAVSALNPGATYTIDIGTPSANGLTGAGFGQDISSTEAGRTFVWIEGDVARVRLPRAGWFGTKVHVVTKPYAPFGARRQRIRALLNDQPLGVVDLTSDWSDVAFDAPRRVWYYGFNVLELHFAYALSPAEFEKTSDRRQLSAAVDAIRVGK